MWLVYLEGSMFCWDEQSCQQRFVMHDYWMSSQAKPWQSTFAQGGIFATDGSSPWGAINRIYVKYCSSDLWSGDAPASSATFGYQFRGSRIVSAVITSLVQKRGMGSVPGSRLLFGGCSAGAIGAMNNLDAVVDLVQPLGLQVQGFLDGAGLLDIQPRGWKWSPWLETLQQLMANMTTFTQPVFPSYCAKHFPGKEWRCLLGQYRMPLISSAPFFVNVPQFDDFELMYDTDNYLPVSPSQLSFVEEFQAGTLALIAALPPNTGVFAPTCLVHCLSGQTTFTQLTLEDGTSLESALSAWFFHGQPVQAVSPCIGWQCVQACGVDMWTGLPCNLPRPGCSPITALQPDPHGTTSSDTSTGGYHVNAVPATMKAEQQTVRADAQDLQVEEATPAGQEQDAEVARLEEESITSESEPPQQQQQGRRRLVGASQTAETSWQARAAARMLAAQGPCCGNEAA